MNVPLRRSLYVLLYAGFSVFLFWPLTTALSYHYLKSDLRTVVSVGFIILESVLGLAAVFAAFRLWLRRKKAGYGILSILTTLLFLVFLGSLVWAFILP